MSDIIEIKGTVHEVMETQTFESGFQKRVLVIKTEDEKYPQTIPVEFVKDKTSLLNGLQRGQAVTACVNLRGNEYNGKYYCNITGWKLESAAAPVTAQPAAAAPAVEPDEIPF
jgi:hypothetical protein